MTKPQRNKRIVTGILGILMLGILYFSETKMGMERHMLFMEYAYEKAFVGGFIFLLFVTGLLYVKRGFDKVTLSSSAVCTLFGIYFFFDPAKFFAPYHYTAAIFCLLLGENELVWPHQR
ncbi:hypothetical protein QO008_000368 [Peptoniphilus ivorii]|uniref:hypothetical protein n=1 Tax=Aedoeadaptatus ivorii TaxID=54006 RepID=UPI0027880C0C|nr:hypothetical protein [Peptoniphilus ivorii]MDQ0507924.1 hypothetical protein [Peptoniphilus ivorii]